VGNGSDDGLSAVALVGMGGFAVTAHLHRDLASEAGRDPIPVTVYAPSPTSERLEQLATIGVHRVLLKAPVADASGWARFLHDSQPLIGADS